MEQSEADRWIEMLGHDFERATRELENQGEPALRRLVQACEGLVNIPLGRRPIDTITNRALALGQLGKRYPELLLELVQGKQALRLSTIQGLGYTENENLTRIATNVARDESEADRWIEELSSDLESATLVLEKLGEPALSQLFHVSEGLVKVPLGQWWKDGMVNRPLALGHLGTLYPEVLLELVQGKTFLALGTIQGLGFTGDERLKTIAKTALKVFGND